jgi:hypothetical protein
MSNMTSIMGLLGVEYRSHVVALILNSSLMAADCYLLEIFSITPHAVLVLLNCLTNVCGLGLFLGRDIARCECESYVLARLADNGTYLDIR